MQPPGPDAKRSPGGTPATVQDPHGHAQVTGDRTPEVRQSGDLGRFLAGRERVLGQRHVVPGDPDAAAEVLAEIHCGKRRAASWLRQVLARLDHKERAS